MEQTTVPDLYSLIRCDMWELIQAKKIATFEWFNSRRVNNPKRMLVWDRIIDEIDSLLIF